MIIYEYKIATVQISLINVIIFFPTGCFYMFSVAYLTVSVYYLFIVILLDVHNLEADITSSIHRLLNKYMLSA